MNTYGYVGANPVMRIDPLGLEWVTVEVEMHTAKNIFHFFFHGLNAVVGENRLPNPHDCIGCTKTVTQEWQSDVWQGCREGDPLDGEIREISQMFGLWQDPFAVSGWSYHWTPAVANRTRN